MDFGKRALGAVYTKKFKLECKVPIDFEFEFKVIKPNTQFAVSPMRGIIPGSGKMLVEVSYTPTTFTTENIVLELNVSEFNSKPITVTIFGSGLPGVKRDGMIKSVIGNADPDMQLIDGARTLKKAQDHRYTPKDGDAMHKYHMEQQREVSRHRDCRRDGPIQAEPFQKPPPFQEVLIGGVYMAPIINGHAETMYIMNQEPGKLRIKDVRAAIESRKFELAEQRVELDKVQGAGEARGIHPLNQPSVSAGIKLAMFKAQQLDQQRSSSRLTASSDAAMLGDTVMTEEQIVEAKRIQTAEMAAGQRETELEAMHRCGGGRGLGG